MKRLYLLMTVFVVALSIYGIRNHPQKVEATGWLSFVVGDTLPEYMLLKIDTDDPTIINFEVQENKIIVKSSFGFTLRISVSTSSTEVQYKNTPSSHRSEAIVWGTGSNMGNFSNYCGYDRSENCSDHFIYITNYITEADREITEVDATLAQYFKYKATSERHQITYSDFAPFTRPIKSFYESDLPLTIDDAPDRVFQNFVQWHLSDQLNSPQPITVFEDTALYGEWERNDYEVDPTAWQSFTDGMTLPKQFVMRVTTSDYTDIWVDHHEVQMVMETVPGIIGRFLMYTSLTATNWTASAGGGFPSGARVFADDNGWRSTCGYEFDASCSQNFVHHDISHLSAANRVLTIHDETIAAHFEYQEYTYGQEEMGPQLKHTEITLLDGDYRISWPSHILEGQMLPVRVEYIEQREMLLETFRPSLYKVYIDAGFTGDISLNHVGQTTSTNSRSLHPSLFIPNHMLPGVTAQSYDDCENCIYYGAFLFDASARALGEHTAIIYGFDSEYAIQSSAQEEMLDLFLELDFEIVSEYSFEPEDMGVFLSDVEDPVTLDDIKAELTVLDYELIDISESLQAFLDKYSHMRFMRVLGDYQTIWHAIDQHGNITFAEVIVRVVDITPPEITLTGDATVYVEFGTNFTEQGATVTDNIDTDPSLVITGTVNVGVLGSYTRTYTATDESGNETFTTRTVIVQDTTPPVIAFQEVYLSNTESAYALALFLSSITAYDTHDGDVTSSVTVVEDNYTGNETSHGTYTVTISVEDASGNETVETFSIIVVNYIPPTITPSDYLLSLEVANAMTQEQIIAHIASKAE